VTEDVITCGKHRQCIVRLKSRGFKSQWVIRCTVCNQESDFSTNKTGDKFRAIRDLMSEECADNGLMTTENGPSSPAVSAPQPSKANSHIFYLKP
jgi:hypothetical protein